MTGHSAAAPAGFLRGIPARWRPMAKATWLQHRGTLIAAAAVAAVMILAIVISGLAAQAAYGRLAAAGCLSGQTGSASCPGLLNSLETRTNGLSLTTITLLVIPVLAGAFIGAPLLASEYESGTYRFAWTQSIGRHRWVTSRLMLLGGAGAAAAGTLGFLAGWYAGPFEAVGLASRWQGGQFSTTVLTLPAWTLFSLAAGTFAGVLIRRVVAAMAATAAFAGGLVVLDFTRLHDWFLGIAPGITRGSPSGTGLGALNTFAVPGGIPGPPGSWLVNGWYTGPDGQRLSSAAVDSLVNQLQTSKSAAALGNPAQWLEQHHDAYWLSYQAASRFWGFQAAEAGLLLAITVMFVIGTITLISRRG
jgi:hypothetical protein